MDEIKEKESKGKDKDIKKYFIIENKANIFLILREKLVIPENLLEIYDREKKEGKILTFIFDIDDLSKDFSDAELFRYFEDVMEENNDYEDTNLNIIIKNCLVKTNTSLFFEDIKLKLNKLYISDELHSMSLDLFSLFKSFRPKILILKSIKINSKLQLENFFNFIINSECEELTLEDFFIELIIKKDNDETYNDLDEYFYFEDGNIVINNYKERNEKEDTKEKKETKLKKLKKLNLIDCPLFAITDDTFKDVNKYKDKEIDIDENSLLNPSMITRFRINKGLSDFCFDLDSYKLNEEGADDYMKNIKYIIDKIINDNNNDYNKLIFKNFDITKYEYITGENLTYIEEKNWILNNEEKARYKKFEEFDEKINDEINKNLNKLSKVKSLVFDNCSNHFIQLILKFINSTKNDLELLKLKKCGKEHFNIKNILSLKINNLILFDIPLIIDSFPDDVLDIENLTIKINTLQYYCNENNLNFDKTIETYIELINHQKLNQNLILEMNTIPTIMEYLSSKKNKKGASQSIIKGLENKTIILKNNNIRHYKLKSKNEKSKKSEKSEEIIQEFDTDINYSSFVKMNKIKTVILKDCNFEESFLDEKTFSFINFINNINEKDKKYTKIDIKSLNDYIYKNHLSFDNYSDFFNHLIKTSIGSTELDLNQKKSIQRIISFEEHLTKLFKSLNNDKKEFTIIFSDIKERKEFYCLLKFFEEMQNNNNFKDYEIPKQKEKIKFLSSEKFKTLKQNLGHYFYQEKSELKQNDDFYTVFNYYYSSEDERNMFGEYGKEKDEIKFGKYKLKIEYLDNSEGNELKVVDPWEVLWN